MTAGTCFISRDQLVAFTQHLADQGIATRPHTDPFVGGIQAQKDGHWMAIVWNKSWKRYTVDSRLAEFVRNFEG